MACLLLLSCQGPVTTRVLREVKGLIECLPPIVGGSRANRRSAQGDIRPIATSPVTRRNLPGADTIEVKNQQPGGPAFQKMAGGLFQMTGWAILRSRVGRFRVRVGKNKGRLFSAEKARFS
jgi:hypothetical protein